MATTIRERITEFAAAQGFKTLSGFEKACGFSKKRENAQGNFVLQLDFLILGWNSSSFLD
jgi:hypothetical protein